MTFAMHTAAERPDLWERGIPAESVWPEYNLHGDVLNQWWGLLDKELPDFQFVLYDEANDEVVAEGHTGPLWWDGTDETLPDGIDAAIEAMRTIAARHGLTHLVAPVRPSMKFCYPITPIEHYVRWRREDGQLFDPWMRVHERLGARVAAALPRSMRITGSVGDWESWTGMAYPESGDYVFPDGLAILHVDRSADLGSYWEPNVWMVHPDLPG